MLAKDVMLLNTEYLPLLVTWVTPHVSEIDKLISSAKKYHPESEFVGYQGSDTEDGYKKEQKGPFRYSIDVSTGQQEIVPLGYIDIDYMKGCVISGSFSAEGGFLGHEIIVQLLLEDEEILYDSGKVQQDSFSEIINKSGNYYLEFDNSFSFLTPKTVPYTLTISYNYDLVNAQVKAIYLALQNDYNIDYVNSTISYPDGITQRIRLPQDALELGSANCIDGAVLFASALENIGLEPLIVLVPGHAFVGWRRWTESNVADFLETTMIGISSFADACNEGNYKFTTNKDKSDTDIIDVKYYRGTYNLTPLMKQIAIK